MIQFCERLYETEVLQDLYSLQMLSAHQNKCNQCLECFTVNIVPYLMPNCKHNICGFCVEEIQKDSNAQIQCQFCSNSITPKKVRRFVQNKYLLKKLKQSVSKPQAHSLSTNSADLSFKIAENLENPFEDELLIEPNETINFKKMQNGQKKLQVKSSNNLLNLCQAHQKTLQIICITDLSMICAHCAIFGNHKSHKFKTIPQFQKDLQKCYETIQNIQQHKNILDKKCEVEEVETETKAQIKMKKKQLKEKVIERINFFMKQLKKIQEKVLMDLEKHFEGIESDIQSVLTQENKIKQEYRIWETSCMKQIKKIEQEVNLNKKIQRLYGPLKNIEKGNQFIDKLEKRNHVQSRKIDAILNSITVEFCNFGGLSNLAKVNRKKEEKKQTIGNFVERTNIPMNKSIVLDEDFGDNSFIHDFSKQEFSLILDGQVKRTPAKCKKQKEKSDLSQTTVFKFKSPPRQFKSPTSKLIRSKSNPFDPNQIMMNESKTKKKIEESQILDCFDKKESQSIVRQFIKQDLKEVLDLSKSDINDDTLSTQLKEVRKHRKIRGLKLSQNQISNVGFSKIIEYLNTTSNLNLAYNQMTEEVLSMIINNRDNLSSLRIVNLSYNKVNERRARTKMETLKKMGIIVNI